MKSTMPQAGWPAPAGNPDQAPPARKKPISRITLALLDEYSEQKSRGYNPYDTRTAQPKPTGDLWRRKPKRD